MSCLQRHADLTVRLEAPDAGAVARARINHDKGSPAFVGLNSVGGQNPDECVVNGTL
jgi:hypothetical protein